MLSFPHNGKYYIDFTLLKKKANKFFQYVFSGNPKTIAISLFKLSNNITKLHILLHNKTCIYTT
jgi:hypothetical protein